jgi:hypothetical protein
LGNAGVETESSIEITIAAAHLTQRHFEHSRPDARLARINWYSKLDYEAVSNAALQ